MATRTRAKLAALLGAAVVSAAATAAATSQPAATAPVAAEQATAAQTASALPAGQQRLRDVIEARLLEAQYAGRHGEIEQLGTLWMTLEQRSQLDREVSSGERFVAAALRNQRRSAYRHTARLKRLMPLEEPQLDALAEERGAIWQTAAGARLPDERLRAEQLLDQLEEPYRTAVMLSAEGWNRREVAEQMGVSHAAVRKWMQRLRERMQ